MPSTLFSTDAYLHVERATLELLNSQQDILSPFSISSPRAAGDAIQEIIASSFDLLFGPWASTYSATFARRAMADLAFSDHAGAYYIVDVKTHRTDTRFNMPNLTSVERLARFYEDDSNYFALLFIAYSVEVNRLVFTRVHFVPIEYLDWRCLTIGALGWGQIQIANSNNLMITPHYPRRTWMLEMCDALLEFYPREIQKITDRIDYFERVRMHWLDKTEG